MDPTLEGISREFGLQDSTATALHAHGARAFLLKPCHALDHGRQVLPKHGNVAPTTANEGGGLYLELTKEPRTCWPEVNVQHSVLTVHVTQQYEVVHVLAVVPSHPR